MDAKEGKGVCQDRGAWRKGVYKKFLTKSVIGVIDARYERFWIFMGPRGGLCLVYVVGLKSIDHHMGPLVSLHVQM